MPPDASNSYCQWLHARLSKIRGRLEEHEALLHPQSEGKCYIGDDSVPEDFLFDRSDFLKAWRCQNNPRIHLLLEGEHEINYIRNAAVSTAQLRPGDIWFFPTDAHDHEEFTTPCRYIGVVFHPAFTRFLEVQHEPTQKKNAINRRTWTNHFRADLPPTVSSSLNALSAMLKAQPEEAASPCELTGNYLTRALWLLILRWLQAEVEDAPALGKAHASWLTIDRYLQENYHRPINRKEASREVGLHPNRISTLCTEFAGKSFNDILQERRLRQATRYLETSSHKIETISALCGYASAPYFSRVFREKMGVTPGQWRLNQRSSKGTADRQVE